MSRTVSLGFHEHVVVELSLIFQKYPPLSPFPLEMTFFMPLPFANPTACAAEIKEGYLAISALVIGFIYITEIGVFEFLGIGSILSFLTVLN